MNTKREKRIRSRVLVVVHDAGGAEVIGAYIQRHLSPQDVVAYGAGPAKRVFRRLHVPLRAIPDDRRAIRKIMEYHRYARYALIAGPGWMTRTEIRALQEAKRAGLKTVVYMDSWVEERKRFGYPRVGWEKSLPDKFWAGDRFAETSLRKKFPRIPVRMVPNCYILNEVRRFRALKRVSRHPDAILFTSTTGNISARLLTHLLKKGTNGRILHIRFHPADERDRYDAIIKKFRGKTHIERSNNAGFVEDLVRAQVVIGAETAAMAIAVACGVPTIRFLEHRTRPMLPFAVIKSARTIKKINRNLDMILQMN